MNTKKLPALKVDNLRHISDHGFAVQFGEPRLADMVARGLANPAGEAKLTAGGSHVKITKLGHVTRTCAFFAVGSRHVDTIHYYDPEKGLKFRVRKQDGDGQASAYETLCAVIFGGELPHVWRTRTGAAQDELQTWLGKWAWTLTGVSGMRAQAMKAGSAHLEAAISSAQNALDYQTRQLGRLEEQTVETFRKRHEQSREHAQYRVNQTDAAIETATADLARLDSVDLSNSAQSSPAELATSSEAETTLREIASKYGAWGRYDYSTGKQQFGWAGTDARMLPAQVSPNYSATINADGEIVLSSGVLCEFRLPAVLAWLRGEAQAPRTRYGAVSKIETCDESGSPRVFLRCGCHTVDAAAANPEIAALLVPTHTVSIDPGSPSAYLGTPEFLPRLRLEISKKLSELRDQRAQLLLGAVQNKRELEDEEKNLPAKIAEQQERINAAQRDLDKANADLAGYAAPIGATADTVQTAVCRAISALNFRITLTREN